MQVIKESTFVDKKEWGDGQWQNEPDKVQMLDEETGLDCLIVRGPVGGLCGYVGVDEKHPLYGKDYSDTDLQCHGGPTFSSFCVEDEKEHGICHAPLPGRPDKVWWFGFDCGHSGDLCPGMASFYKKNGLHGSYPGYTYRDISYVKNECANLAKQLGGMK